MDYKGGDEVERRLAVMFDKMNANSKRLIANTMKKARRLGSDDHHAFLDYMTEEEISQFLCSQLPVIKLCDGKYMIGTEQKPILVRSDRLLIRVGGGFVTLEEYLNKNSLSENIKFSKVMKSQNCSFKEAVKFYLEKHEAPEKVIQDYLKVEESNSELYEKTMAKIQEREDEKKFQIDKDERSFESMIKQIKSDEAQADNSGLQPKGTPMFKHC